MNPHAEGRTHFVDSRGIESMRGRGKCLQMSGEESQSYCPYLVFKTVANEENGNKGEGGVKRDLQR